MASPLVVALPKDEAIDVANGRRSAVVVGVVVAGGGVGDAGRACPGRCVVGRRSLRRPVRRVLPCQPGAAVDSDRDLSAVDVLEVPLPVGVRVAVSGGDGLDWLAA